MIIAKINSILDQVKEVDNETYDHLERTALLSFALAKNIKLGPKEMELAYFAGLLHDIGVLEAAKSDSESISLYSSLMLKFVDGLEKISEAVKYQNNYKLLDKESFSYLLAQILAIVNKYDELRTQDGLSHDEAKGLLVNFDANLIEKFIEIIEKEDLT